MHKTARFAAIGLAILLLATSASARQPGEYPLTPDSLAQPNIAHGRVLGPFEFHSGIIRGTVRRYWIYLPAGYEATAAKTAPLNLIVVQDGQRFLDPGGTTRVPNVLDNLIAKGEIPPALGLFVTPGNVSDHYPADLGMDNPDHRAEEYDSLDDDYARMLIDELLPEVARTYRFTDDPRKRIILGASSGAIAAFTVAWNRPEAFGNVISFIGSFTSVGSHPATSMSSFLPGGDVYPGLIRKSQIRPLRIFLQDGSHDLNNEHGDWFLSNQQMVSSILWANANAEAGKLGPYRYDLRYVWGDGAHSGAHGGQLLPDILRWMWGEGSARPVSENRIGSWPTKPAPPLRPSRAAAS